MSDSEAPEGPDGVDHLVAERYEVGALTLSSPCTEVLRGIVKVQAAEPRLAKTKVAKVKNKAGVELYEYHYADLGLTLAAIRESMGKAGLGVAWGIATHRGEVIVTTMVFHGESEQWMSTTMATPNEKGGSVQGVGSGSTYLRRYGVTALLGLATEDDDGRGASPQPKPQAPPKEPRERLLSAWFGRLRKLQDAGLIPGQLSDEDRQALQEKLWGVRHSAELSPDAVQWHLGQLHRTPDGDLGTLANSILMGDEPDPDKDRE